MEQALPSFHALFNVPPTLAAMWSARAIYNLRPSVYIDVLHDRQYMCGENQSQEAKDLCDWLNTEGIKGLQSVCKQMGLGPDESRVVEYSSKGFIIQGCPNSSHGYLYIVAYRMPIAAHRS